MSAQPTSNERCTWAIKFGMSLTTRCHKQTGHHDMHEGHGLAEFPYQRISWLPGDSREFETARTDEAVWED